MIPVFQYGLANNHQLPFWAHQNPEVLVTPDIISVSVYATLQIQNINTEGLLIREGEINAQVNGDFVEQFNGHLGHNPAEDFRPYAGLIDNISTVFNRTLPIQNGSAQWNIPIELQRPGEMEIIQAEVVQRYELNNGNLSISKGGTLLFQRDIP